MVDVPTSPVIGSMAVTSKVMPFSAAPVVRANLPPAIMVTVVVVQGGVNGSLHTVPAAVVISYVEKDPPATVKINVPPPIGRVRFSGVRVIAGAEDWVTDAVACCEMP